MIILEFNASEAIWKNYLRIKPMRAKRAENVWKNCHVFPNSRKVKVRLFIFFQKRTDYLFSAFSRPEYLFPKSASPLPPQNQMVVALKKRTLC